MGRNWHKSVVFGVHLDIHALRDERGHGRGLTDKNLEEYLAAARPDFLQCDSKGHPGITTWPSEVGTSAPDLARDSLRVYRRVTARAGIPLVAHYSGVLDAEALRSHPEWAVVGPDGSTSATATSLTSAYAVELMVPQMLEILDSYGLDGLWVDGECWGARPDWSDSTRAAFEGSVSAGTPTPTGPDEPHWQQWMTFNRDLFRSHVDFYKKELGNHAPGATVVSNWQYSTRMPDLLPSEVDYVSGDVGYGMDIEDVAVESVYLDSLGVDWDLMIWAIEESSAGEWVLALKSQDRARQEAAIILSRDGVVNVYDQPDRSGHLLNWHGLWLGELSDFVRQHASVDRGESVADALILLSPDHHWDQLNSVYKFSPATGATSVTITNHDELFVPSLGTDTVRAAVTILNELHITCDVRSTENPADWAAYKILVIPEQGSLSLLSEKIGEFAAAGGLVLITGADEAQLPEELTGTLFSESEGKRWTWLNGPAEGTTPVESSTADLTLIGAAPVRYGMPHDWDTGAVADFESRCEIARFPVGDGAVIVTGTRLFKTARNVGSGGIRDLIGGLLTGSLVSPDPLLITDAPSWVWFNVRKGSRETTVHIVNTSTDAPSATSPQKVGVVPHVPRVGFTLRCAEESAVMGCVPSEALESWQVTDRGIEVILSDIHIHVSVRIGPSI